MFFRPSFCANCGEKIERAEWGLLTSRRFCQVCEIEFKGQDLIPRVLAGTGILIGIFGFGSYLKSGSASTEVNVAASQSRRLAERKKDPGPSTVTDQKRTGSDGANSQVIASAPSPEAITPPVQRPEGSRPVAKTASSEPAYFCGAETKKGTPCSRRVKGNVRCFQHPGMPAMVAADKLRISDAR